MKSETVLIAAVIAWLLLSNWRIVVPVTGVLLFLAVVALYKFQTFLIYPSHLPEGSRQQVDSPADWQMSVYEHVWIPVAASSGVKIHAYFIPSRSSTLRKPWTVVYCHANAGNMGHRLPVIKKLRQLLNDAVNVFIFEYRGYGLSEGGSASESGLKQDGRAAMDWLLSSNEKYRHLIDNERIVMFGQSIGAALAIYLTSQYKTNVRALILENPFLSIPKLIPHVLQDSMRIPPYISSIIALLCSEKWDNENQIKKCAKDLKVLVVSSELDELVPPADQRELYKSMPMTDKKFHMVPRATHNDAVAYPEYWSAVESFWAQYIRSF